MPTDLAADAARYWAKASSDPRVRNQAHWRGEGRWKDDAAWLGIGASTLTRAVALAELADLPTPRDVFEWGVGGGSNVVAFARQVQSYFGVDICRATLEQAKAA